MAAVPDDKTLRMVRVFDASRERVFDTFVEQDQFIQWMCPPDVKVEKCRLDPRPGGEWRIEGRSSKGRFATSGKYVEVRRPEGLVFTWAHMRTPTSPARAAMRRRCASSSAPRAKDRADPDPWAVRRHAELRGSRRRLDRLL